MNHDKLKAPFPAFGGKSRIAGLVWERLGDVDNFIEPFCNSAAVLLARPHPPRIETVNDPSLMHDNAWRSTHPETGDVGAVADSVCEVINDLDPYIANVWRSLREAPEETALWADAPVVESYMHAVHRWLVLGEEATEFRARVRSDPDYFDPKRAGRYLFGACCWIGSGWCQTPDSAEWENKPHLGQGSHEGKSQGRGVHASVPDKRPPLAGPAKLHEQRPVLETRGVHAKGPVPATWEMRPLLKGNHSTGGQGVHNEKLADAHRPQLADAYSRGRGVHGHDEAGTCEQRRAWLIDWFGRLRDRLRTVRVCCGAWDRVCSSPSVTTRLGLTGIFLDAPYKTHLSNGKTNRAGNLYSNDGSQDVNKLVDDVIAYCLKRGKDPMMRICAASYEGEGYEVLLGHGWESVAWVASGGYGNRSAKGKENAKRERLWVSPHCVRPGDDLPLFAGLE